MLRTLAVTWIRNNSHNELWEGTTIADMIRATTSQSLDTYLANMSKMGTWVDTAFLHGLACSCHVDIIIFQEDMDPTLVGSSLAGGAVEALVPIALVNSFHFWAMEPAQCEMVMVSKGDSFLIAGTVLPQQQGGTAASSAKPRKSGGTVLSQGDDEEDEHDTFQESMPSREEVQIDAELSLCNVLIQWSPFTTPQPEVLDAMSQLCAVREHLPMPAKKEVPADVALARQHAIRQLASESEALQVLQAFKQSDWQVQWCNLKLQNGMRAERCAYLGSRRCRKRSGSNVPWSTSRTWAPLAPWRRKTT